MEIKWGHLCTDVLWMDTGAGILNVIYAVGADPGKPPALPATTHLAIRVVGTAEEAKGQVLQAVLTDETDQAVGPPIVVPVTYQPLGSGYPTLGGGKIRLDGRYNLPGVGAYSFDFTFDYAAGEKPLGRVPLTIAPREGKLIKPKLQSADPVRLAWAHFMMGREERVPGLPSLVGVYEFVVLPPGERRYNLKGTQLLLQIEADLTIETNRQLRVRLLDAGGLPAQDSNRNQIPPYDRPITLRRPSLGVDMLVSTAPVYFNDVFLDPGSYTFDFELDRKPLGKPLPLTIIPPQTGVSGT